MAALPGGGGYCVARAARHRLPRGHHAAVVWQYAAVVWQYAADVWQYAAVVWQYAAAARGGRVTALYGAVLTRPDAGGISPAGRRGVSGREGMQVGNVRRSAERCSSARRQLNSPPPSPPLQCIPLFNDLFVLRRSVALPPFLPLLISLTLYPRQARL